MNNIWAKITIGITIGAWLLSMAIESSINAKPSRIAVMDLTPTQKGTNTRLDVRSTAALTDAKLIDWVDKVLATCFSLTTENITTKSQYCEKTYFKSAAGAAYQYSWVSSLQKQLSQSAGALYVGMPVAPFITQSSSRRSLRYVVFAQMLVSRVERGSVTPDIRQVRLFIMPTLQAANPNQYSIVGIQF